MLVLPVASALGRQLPTVVFEQPNELTKLQIDHRAGAFGWAMA